MTQFASTLRFGLLAAVFSFGAVAAHAGATAPAPVKVVSPVGLPAWSENSTVKVVLTVGADGSPSDVKVANWTPSELAHPLVAAVKEWRFVPSYVDGHAVATRVVIPVHLVAGDANQPVRIAMRGGKS